MRTWPAEQLRDIGHTNPEAANARPRGALVMKTIGRYRLPFDPQAGLTLSGAVGAGHVAEGCVAGIHLHTREIVSVEQVEHLQPQLESRSLEHREPLGQTGVLS